MKVISNVRELKKWVQGKQIALVPTMGNLHEGHLVLIKRARKSCLNVAVSIFVNPKQFGPKEDFKSYPRTLAQDKALLSKHGVDMLFCPQTKDIYQGDLENFQTYVGNKVLENRFCGKYRPGFFNGVLLVVLKLFNLITPTVAVFGKKDYQQYVLIKQMVSDLNLDIHVVGVQTKRNAGGLALSSRNQYLTQSEQTDAQHIYKCLKIGKHEVLSGKINTPKTLLNRIIFLLYKNTKLKTQYLEVVDKTTLQAIRHLKNAVVLYAGFYGKVRLIDNIEI